MPKKRKKPAQVYIGRDGIGYCPGCAACRTFKPGMFSCSACGYLLKAEPICLYRNKYLQNPRKIAGCPEKKWRARLLFLEHTPEGKREDGSIQTFSD